MKPRIIKGEGVFSRISSSTKRENSSLSRFLLAGHHEELHQHTLTPAEKTTRFSIATHGSQLPSVPQNSRPDTEAMESCPEVNFEIDILSAQGASRASISLGAGNQPTLALKQPTAPKNGIPSSVKGKHGLMAKLDTRIAKKAVRASPSVRKQKLADSRQVRDIPTMRAIYQRAREIWLKDKEELAAAVAAASARTKLERQKSRLGTTTLGRIVRAIMLATRQVTFSKHIANMFGEMAAEAVKERKLEAEEEARIETEEQRKLKAEHDAANEQEHDATHDEGLRLPTGAKRRGARTHMYRAPTCDFVAKCNVRARRFADRSSLSTRSHGARRGSAVLHDLFALAEKEDAEKEDIEEAEQPKDVEELTSHQEAQQVCTANALKLVQLQYAAIPLTARIHTVPKRWRGHSPAAYVQFQEMYEEAQQLEASFKEAVKETIKSLEDFVDTEVAVCRHLHVMQTGKLMELEEAVVCDECQQMISADFAKPGELLWLCLECERSGEPFYACSSCSASRGIAPAIKELNGLRPSPGWVDAMAKVENSLRIGATRFNQERHCPTPSSHFDDEDDASGDPQRNSSPDGGAMEQRPRTPDDVEAIAGSEPSTLSRKKSSKVTPAPARSGSFGLGFNADLDVTLTGHGMASSRKPQSEDVKEKVQETADEAEAGKAIRFRFDGTIGQSIRFQVDDGEGEERKLVADEEDSPDESCLPAQPQSPGPLCHVIELALDMPEHDMWGRILSGHEEPSVDFWDEYRQRMAVVPDKRRYKCAPSPKQKQGIKIPRRVVGPSLEETCIKREGEAIKQPKRLKHRVVQERRLVAVAEGEELARRIMPALFAEAKCGKPYEVEDFCEGVEIGAAWNGEDATFLTGMGPSLHSPKLERSPVAVAEAVSVARRLLVADCGGRAATPADLSKCDAGADLHLQIWRATAASWGSALAAYAETQLKATSPAAVRPVSQPVGQLNQSPVQPSTPAVAARSKERPNSAEQPAAMVPLLATHSSHSSLHGASEGPTAEAGVALHSAREDISEDSSLTSACSTPGGSQAPLPPHSACRRASTEFVAGVRRVSTEFAASSLHQLGHISDEKWALIQQRMEEEVSIANGTGFSEDGWAVVRQFLDDALGQQLSGSPGLSEEEWAAVQHVFMTPKQQQEVSDTKAREQDDDDNDDADDDVLSCLSRVLSHATLPNDDIGAQDCRNEARTVGANTTEVAANVARSASSQARNQSRSWASPSPLNRMPTPCGRQPRTGDYWSQNRRAYYKSRFRGIGEVLAPHADACQDLAPYASHEAQLLPIFGSKNGKVPNRSGNAGPQRLDMIKTGRPATGMRKTPLSVKRWVDAFRRYSEMPDLPLDEDGEGWHDATMRCQSAVPLLDEDAESWPGMTTRCQSSMA